MIHRGTRRADLYIRVDLDVKVTSSKARKMVALAKVDRI
jgi:hypothetical protein